MLYAFKPLAQADRVFLLQKVPQGDSYILRNFRDILKMQIRLDAPLIPAGLHFNDKSHDGGL